MKQDAYKIILENVEHIYKNEKKGPIQALGGISFSVKEGEIFSLVGKSGSGKTTILNIIAGFIICTRGRVLLDGKEIVGPGNDRVVIFQDDAVFPWFTVEENIRYGLEWIKGLSKQEVKTKVDSILDAVELKHRRSSYPKNLSGGERKRIELARSFIIAPDVILADEPFQNLDTTTKYSLQVLLLNIWEKKKNTIIFATHNVDEALFLSDKVAILTHPPARIKEIIEVPFPRKRKLSIRSHPDFIMLRDKIESLL